MTYETVMERVKSVPPDKLDALNEYIVCLVKGGRNIQDRFGCLKDDIEEPNALTESAMLEAERIAHDARVKQYSVEEALLELKK